MSLALVITDRSTDALAGSLLKIKPELDLQIWPNISRPEKVTFAVLWKQPQGLLRSFKNLKAVTSLGAGIDFIIKDKDLKKSINVSRIVTDNLKVQMAQYVLSYVLQDYRQLTAYKTHQSEHNWQNQDLQPATIGFLGFGKIAKFVAKQCQFLGFNIIAYTNGSKHSEFECNHGKTGLEKVMSQSDYLVCLLPLTQETNGILNYKTFSYCKKSPVLIHVGRGEQLVETDLLQALDKQLIKQAIIDVFETEPLPVNHVFWGRADIRITPHNAARSDIQQTAKAIIRRYEQSINNKPMDLQIDGSY